ncbi:MAG: GGDEF domain-containing protein [Vulcanimicrobiaceae bacterium]
MLRRLAVLGFLVACIVLAPAAARAQDTAPILPPGTPLGDAAPASLLAPSTLQATFRVPPIGGLSIATTWLARGFTVTLTYPGGRHETIVATPSLPGGLLGVRLPDDAWRATRIDVGGTLVSQEAIPVLITDDILARSVARRWWDVVACGAFFALALLAAILALVRRTRAYAALTVAAAANCLLSIPFVGIVRPPPDVSQPLHALVFALGLAATLTVILNAAAAARPSRALVVLTIILAAATAVYVAGDDIAQDLWLGGNAVLLGILDHALPTAVALATLAIALVAARRTPNGALLVVATAAATIAAGLGLVLPFWHDDAVGPILHVALTAGPLAELLLLAALLATTDVPAVVALAPAPLIAAPPPAPVEIDGLTGVANRIAFADALRAAWHASEGASLALVLLDLDHFRRYNERYSHLEGDEALRRIASALAGACADVPDALVARYGDDEFALLLPGQGPRAALALAQRAHAAIGALQIPHTAVPLLHLHASVGVAACVPERDVAPDALLRRATAALYVAKTMGRNRVVLDEPQEPLKTESGNPSLSA